MEEMSSIGTFMIHAPSIKLACINVTKFFITWFVFLAAAKKRQEIAEQVKEMSRNFEVGFWFDLFMLCLLHKKIGWDKRCNFCPIDTGPV